MGGLMLAFETACDSGSDNGGAVPVAGVVLDDEHRADAVLLGTDGRGQVGKIDITPMDLAFFCLVMLFSFAFEGWGRSAML